MLKDFTDSAIATFEGADVLHGGDHLCGSISRTGRVTDRLQTFQVIDVVADKGQILQITGQIRSDLVQSLPLVFDTLVDDRNFQFFTAAAGYL